jgi:integrin alpha 8
VSDPDVIRFNLSAYTSIIDRQHETQVGPQVTHIYELGNRGPSEIVSADVYLLWPSRTLTGTHPFNIPIELMFNFIQKLGKELLYLVEQPVVDGPATCSRVENFNPQALRVIN